MNELTFEEIGMVDGASLIAAIGEGAAAGGFVGAFASPAGAAVGAIAGGVIGAALYYW